jgi:putative Mg2+ transporter-C (MgtC) family protein
VISELWKAISEDFATLQFGPDLARSIVRLTIAALLGSVLGLQRERAHQAAGLRTHMLVTLGAALFILTILQAGGDNQALSRVIQGIATGIGFIGAGAIIKLDREHEVHGLTTAAGIWMATAIGISAGLGRLDLALPATVLAVIILAGVRKLEIHSPTSEHPPESK